MNKIKSFKNKGLSRGLGIGLGIIFTFLSKEFQNELLYTLTTKYPQLSMGLGKGIGSILVYLSDDSRDSFLKLADENQYFAIGIGEGIGEIFFNCMNLDLRTFLLSRTKQNHHFLKGLGIGLGNFFRYYEKNSESRQEILKNILTIPSVSEGFGIGIGAGHVTAALASANSPAVDLKDLSINRFL